MFKPIIETCNRSRTLRSIVVHRSTTLEEVPTWQGDKWLEGGHGMPFIIPISDHRVVIC